MDQSFAVLGLKGGESVAEVKAAYRKLAKKHHPDVGGGSTSEEAFKLITAAYTKALRASADREKMPREAPRHAAANTSSRRAPQAVHGATPHKSQFDVREWESAHYGMHEAARDSQQSLRARQLHRMHLHARAHAARQGKASKPQTFGVWLASAGALMTVW
eukprot:CAMPEP_0183362546 /NCGR_PEP_ID=MMETSP0164_2-20130417/70051_1 /TAXON_ID=221442 /ORGANISM="Coccolithus pelagicus ssp braarudi, Strain PLY182g" /LENGTH=160 /DNA_ID=CAMNT_0025537435 /DNA_START=265 /DNA_END=744 /DNA_ORIENTATION=-